MRYALKFAYDGRAFEGYARQPDCRTVEGEVIAAMQKLGMIEDSGNDRFQSASRTDRGVSAAGNALAVSTEFQKKDIIPALNSQLSGIRFYGITEVDDEFNPRHAREGWYRYVLLGEQCPSLDELDQAARAFVGEHDFEHFSKRDSGQENTMIELDSIELSESDGFVYIDIRAQRFLWQMVRRVVSAMMSITNDEVKLEAIVKMLEGSSLKLANPPPAPPEPLILMDVSYGFAFEHHGGQSDIFQEEHYTARLRAESMSQIMKRISSV